MTTFDSNTINKIIELSKPNISEHHNAKYSDKKLHRIEEPTISPLQIHNLSGMIDYLVSGIDKMGSQDNPVVLHVVDYNRVELISCLNIDSTRNTIIQAILPNSMEFESLSKYDQERSIVALQSKFKETQLRQKLLKIIGTIISSGTVTSLDDGITQAVTTQAGAVLRGTENLPNPIELRPWRTFREIEQPASKFVIRLHKDTKFSLIEAEGDEWKLVAIQNIKKYFLEELKKHNLKIPVIA